MRRAFGIAVVAAWLRIQLTGGDELIGDASALRLGMTQTPQNGEVSVLASWRRTF